jgi:hypothetical protein
MTPEERCDSLGLTGTTRVLVMKAIREAVNDAWDDAARVLHTNANVLEEMNVADDLPPSPMVADLRRIAAAFMARKKV